MNYYKWLTNWKYRYFTRKLRGVNSVMADLAFKRFKTLEIREDLRQEYDGVKQRLEMTNAKIKAESEPGKLKDTNIDEFKRLEDQKVLLERDAERMVKGHPTDSSIVCLEGLDLAVFGSGPTPENPHGVQGIDQEIEAMQELKEMLQSYINKEL